MTTFRKEALRIALNRNASRFSLNGEKISELFGSFVFGKEAMREFLHEEAFESLMKTISEGTAIDRKIADQVASAMKAWATGKGATHYTH